MEKLYPSEFTFEKFPYEKYTETYFVVLYIMPTVRKYELKKYKIMTEGEGIYLNPYRSLNNPQGKGVYVGRGYYKPKRQPGVGQQY